jgi:hypothetical protein
MPHYIINVTTLKNRLLGVIQIIRDTLGGGGRRSVTHSSLDFKTFGSNNFCVSFKMLIFFLFTT